jgi:TM2 domain-containing membrane protein YozV
MLDSRIPLKNPWVAGILAFLLPGAGHFYQGRFFKGILYSVCILSTFVMGMGMGDWSVVYWKQDPSNVLNPYYAQFFVGLPALPALLQSRRYQSRDNAEVMELTASQRSPFTGIFKVDDNSSGFPSGKIEGTLTLEPYTDPAIGRGIRGTLAGTLTPPKGEPITRDLQLAMPVSLGKPVSADPERDLVGDVYSEGTGAGSKKIGRIHGNIPRAFLDRFEAPPDEDYYLALHRELGKFFELAITFTMIAGLLNILAILDAVEGPAYGYGDAEDAIPPKTDGASAAPPSPTKPTPPTPIEPAGEPGKG